MKDFGFLLLTIALIQNDLYMPKLTSSLKVFRVFLLQLVFIAALPAIVYSQSPLDNCADLFIDGQITNAPTLFNSSPDEPYGTNIHQCYRIENASFFAMEYWPEIFAPRWVAYKLSPENYGENGCNTFTRSTAGCYFRSNTWEEFESCTDGSDPFHSDYMLPENKLGTDDFRNTGHDRGHLAPAQAFS